MRTDASRPTKSARLISSLSSSGSSPSPENASSKFPNFDPGLTKSLNRSSNLVPACLPAATANDSATGGNRRLGGCPLDREWDCHRDVPFCTLPANWLPARLGTGREEVGAKVDRRPSSRNG